MRSRGMPLCFISLRNVMRIAAVSVALMFAAVAPASAATLDGNVFGSDAQALPNYRVSLYGAVVGALLDSPTGLY